MTVDDVTRPAEIPAPEALDRVFHESLPWGTYWPQGSAARILSLCHGLPTHRRVYYSLNKLLRGPVKNARPRVYDVQSLGLKLRLLTRGNYCETTALFAPGFYDRRELDWLCARLGAGRTFLDIGGNVGLYTLVALNRQPGTRVLTVEPDPRLRTRMQFNAASNGLVTEACAIALSDYVGEGELVRSVAQSGANQLDADTASPDVSAGAKTQAGSASPGQPDAPGPDGQRLAVPVTTLLSLCDDACVERIDVMKIDIEGHEKPVLDHWFEHADEARWPRSIIIESSHDEMGVVARLERRLGYRREGTTPRNVLLSRDR